MMERIEVLKKYWGYNEFRPLQEEIINSVLQKRDTLALMPTGGGKSICFQVPALMQEGICIVISPLIALMKDQVENLRERNIEAISLFSGMGKREVDLALDNCIYGPVKFLYISPERLESELVLERIRHMQVNLFAIDEAHCISQWGYDFRPAYLNISQLRELHPEVPYLALTATATPDVVVDIQEKLNFTEGMVHKKSFFRENLAYMVLKEENKQGRMLKIIRKLGGSGIIYVRNRRETQETARLLINEGIAADFYHAGLSADERTRKQDGWKSDQIRVIVATNAFGMGIDKPDVRFVIHLEPPDSLEAYYQEAGRGGRDGLKSYAVLLYHESDLVQLQKKFEYSFPSINFVRKVYQNLGNYFQLAYGAGEGLTLDFDLGDFCQRYKQEPISVISALKFLERDGWLALSESVYVPSRLKFELASTDLYKYQVEHPHSDRFIKAVLRMYGGAFDYYVPIREYDLSRKFNLSFAHVIEQLQLLHNQGVLDYIPQTDSPQIHYLQPRMDGQHLHIDAPFIKLRKDAGKTKLDAVFGYLERNLCRSRQLLAYFDEPDSKPCGICDHCLQKDREPVPAIEMTQYLQELLSERELHLSQVIDQLTGTFDWGNEAQKLAFIRDCLDNGMLVENHGVIRLANH